MSSKAFEPQASVHALSDSTTASMRAHMQFPSPSAVVQALLYNALDAGAKKISLTADLVAGSIECSDDGLGFPPAFFSQGSDRGAQSSMPWAQGPVRIRTGRYGRKQESLQLMAYLGRVSIRSTPDNCSNECFLRIQRGDRCIFSGKDREAPPPLNGFRSGSSVCVSDLFANLPVRRRAADTAWSRRAETNKIHAVVKTVSLREPHVSFALRMQSQGSLEGSRRSVQEALRLQKTTSILSRFVDAHGRSTINPADLLDFQYTTSDPDGLVLQGLFSAVPSPSRDIQYVYVNKHPLAQNTSLLEHLSGASIMFSTDKAQDQNPTFTKAASHHGIVDLDSDLYGIMAMVLQHAMQASPTTMYQALARPKGADLDSPRGSPTKASTCFPIFYLDVTIGPAALNRRTSIPNIQISPPLSLKAILQEQIVRGLRLRTEKTRIGSPFWETMTVPTHQKDDRGSPFEFSVLNHSPHAKASPCPEPLSSKSGTQDVDPGPSSKTAGDVTNHLLFDSNSTARSRAFTSPTKRLHRLSRPEHGDVKTQTTTPEWLNAATSTWRNPTLPLPSEPDIPCVGLRSGSLKEASQTAIRRQYLEDQADPRTAVLSNAPVLGSSAGKLKGDLSQKAKQTYPRSSLMDFQQPEEAHASISKDDIRLSRVIGQVDRKFILCTTNVSTKSDRDSGAAPTLLLVDQHAADGEE
ncbi:DNA mismatch repair protein [Tilletia horrida]|uniref:DNA mismatch repair protein n=1 Tax=Tilletia horrida TaxID=155126 RepID=A0AAN6GL09_9BASI|nr:DNA mismatch repair protein [Tilletia horrida]